MPRASSPVPRRTSSIVAGRATTTVAAVARANVLPASGVNDHTIQQVVRTQAADAYRSRQRRRLRQPLRTLSAAHRISGHGHGCMALARALHSRSHHRSAPRGRRPAPASSAADGAAATSDRQINLVARPHLQPHKRGHTQPARQIHAQCRTAYGRAPAPGALTRAPGGGGDFIPTHQLPAVTPHSAHGTATQARANLLAPCAAGTSVAPPGRRTAMRGARVGVPPAWHAGGTPTRHASPSLKI